MAFCFSGISRRILWRSCLWMASAVVLSCVAIFWVLIFERMRPRCEGVCNCATGLPSVVSFCVRFILSKTDIAFGGRSMPAPIGFVEGCFSSIVTL